MMPNEFGQLFKITSFGESHGKAMGVVIQGCPSGLEVDESIINNYLQRRRPGSLPWVSSRSEPENFEILSGVFEGKTLGTPIAVTVYNTNQKSKDYDYIKDNPRVGHADDTWKNKFFHTDHRGGGRSSGRETLSRVIGGAFAEMLVKQSSSSTKIISKISKLGPLINTTDEAYPVGTEELLTTAKESGESYGGHISLTISNPVKNLGQPVFKKLKSELTSAMMSIGAVVGVEFEDSFVNVLKKGTEFHNSATSKKYSGIRGGISTGKDINLIIAMKPTSSIKDTAKQGRHDPCILIRALPVVESMAYLVLADQILWSRLDNI